MTAADKTAAGLDAGHGWEWETALEPLDERDVAAMLEDLEAELDRVLAAA